MRTVAIILARAGSKGIPNKNRMDFCGKPLYAWTVEQLIHSNTLHRDGDIYLSTNDYSLMNDCRARFGSRVTLIDRPNQLCEDDTPSDLALQHVVDHQMFDDDTLIIHPQITSPLRIPKDILHAVNDFEWNKADSVFSGSICTDYCIWNHKGKSITYNYKKRGNRQHKKVLYLENGSFYLTTPKTLRKYKNRLGGKIQVHLMFPWQSFELDEPSDIEIVEYFMRSKILTSGV